ncbi:hypothetical protein D9611_014623 [Ephemerocybe angulata]|uniref:Uncharacterized protein n=1 Tax=Ephemerocybe angulata TaxID=980116 RepID=A0A8H5FIX5_9AGAR|nr:hypothetical protein D9611_014623 [Tulosesus angulatus]
MVAGNGRVSEETVMKIHGSLCHIAFVHQLGRSYLASFSSFIAHFHKYPNGTLLHAPPSIKKDIAWWIRTLSTPGFVRTLHPLGEILDLDISVDASTDWGIGIVWGSAWDAWRLRDGWKGPWRDIGWLECLAIELLVLHIEAHGFHDCRIRVRSDNQGIIGASDKGRSRNVEVNYSIRRFMFILDSLHISLSLDYIKSAENPSDRISRGDLGTEADRLSSSITLPEELHPYIQHNGSGTSVATSPTSLLSSTSPRTFSDQNPSSSRSVSSLGPTSVSDVLASRSSIGRVVVPRRRKLKSGLPSTSELRPNVPAKDRLSHWLTSYSVRHFAEMRAIIPIADIRAINITAASSYDENTRTTYAAGLRHFMDYCDNLVPPVPEDDRMPASKVLLAGFIGSWSSKVSGSSLRNWFSGLRAWHVINDAEWHGDDLFVTQLKVGARKLAPPTSKRPPRNPVTIEHLIALMHTLDISSSLDAAIWAAACCAFWGCCRLGELVCTLAGSFDAAKQPSRVFARVLFKSTVTTSRTTQDAVCFHIPFTKTTKELGAELRITGDAVCSPVAAMKNHLFVNSGIPLQSHLFSYLVDGAWRHLTKSVMMARCEAIWTSYGLVHVDGHRFRIGGATELLVGGVPPEVVAAIGRWTSLAFLLYWLRFL